MQDVDEEVRVGDPLFHRVPEQRLNLRARVNIARVVVQLVDVDDERELLDEPLIVSLERAVPGVCLVEQPRRLPDDAHEGGDHEHREGEEVEWAVEGTALTGPGEHAARNDDGDSGRQQAQPEDTTARRRPLREQRGRKAG